MPISAPLIIRLRRLNSPRLTEESPNHAITIAVSSDNKVVGTSYETGNGKRKPSMPMKCIDQMPVPIEIAPPASQYRPLVRPKEATTRAARFSATKDAVTETTTESSTSQ